MLIFFTLNLTENNNCKRYEEYEYYKKRLLITVDMVNTHRYISLHIYLHKGRFICSEFVCPGPSGLATHLLDFYPSTLTRPRNQTIDDDG